MEQRNPQHKSFLRYLDFEPFTWHTFYGEQCPLFVTEENQEAWRRYLTIVIKKHLKAEVMNTPEFRDIELQIRGEKLLACMNWQELYFFASKQALLGLCFEGIERLGKEYPEEMKQNPIGRELLMTWMGKAQQIRRQNMKVNAVASKLFSMLREVGMRCCVLKGQGNALMYPNPYSRTPGDIDVWIDASRERIMEYAQKKFELGDDIRLQHLETSLDDVPVELHFFPCSMNNILYHARLQKWFRRNADLQCSHIVGLPDGAGDIAIPTTAFNVIYQLTHLYHHFFDEGIGMRQIIDYYYVVNNDELLVIRDTLQRELKYLGLWKFAKAVMYVLHEALGLSEKKMIAPMDEKRGKLLLAEILEGGNFGQYFTKYGHFTQQGMAKKYFLKIWRNMHFVRYYPAEALSEPIFRTWHFFWRMKNKK